MLRLTATALAAAFLLSLAACDDKGPVEQTGEEIDEAVDTIRNGGEESTANKVDDAIDEAREGAKDAAEEVKQE